MKRELHGNISFMPINEDYLPKPGDGRTREEIKQAAFARIPAIPVQTKCEDCYDELRFENSKYGVNCLKRRQKAAMKNDNWLAITIAIIAAAAFLGIFTYFAEQSVK